MSVAETQVIPPTASDPVSEAQTIEEIDANNAAEIQAGGYQQGDDVEVEELSTIAAGIAWLEHGTPEQPRQSALYLECKSPAELKAVIKGIASIVDEATFEYTPEGLIFRSMDPSHIALIDVFWPNHGFEAYECDGHGKVAVRVDEMKRVLADFDDKRDSIKIRYDPYDSEMMLSLDNGNGSVVKMRTIETSASTTPLPKLRYDTKVEMSSKVLEKTLKAVHKVSEHVSFSSKTGRISFHGKGDGGERSTRFEPGMEGLELLHVQEDSRATYSLDYLIGAHNALKTLHPTTVFEYSSKMPIRVEYKIANIGKVHFYIAPRVQD